MKEKATSTPITADLRNRMEGCLWGIFCGDALGAPIEFKSPAEVQGHYPQGVTDMVAGWGYTAERWVGYISDDSEMSIALLLSLVSAQGFSSERTWDLYQAWVDSDPGDVGLTISLALARGEHSPESEANGTLMRVAPVALYAACHPGWDWTEAAMGDALITHINPKCSKANVIYVESLLLALQGETPQCIYERALYRAQDLQEHELLELLQKAATEEPAYWPQGGWLHHAFQATYYWMLHAQDFRSAMLTLVNRLGDPDTNGAIVGAMLGALYGRDGIPQNWKDTLLAARKRTDTFTVENAFLLLNKLCNAPA